MSDLIDRQAMLKHIEKIRQDALMMDDIHRASIIMNGMHLCEEAVRNQPSAEPERKKGKWIKVGDYSWDCSWKCNKCGEISCCHADFCPDCGAEMEKDDEIS